MITKLAITLLIIVFTAVALKATWSIDSKPKEGHNICLGPKAGQDITDESYQFRLRTDPNGPEYSTVMTHKEYEVVHSVVTRAVWNKRH